MIYSTKNQNGYIVDFKTIPETFNTTYEVNGYYEKTDEEIKKYNFNHQEIKSDLYDKILFVGIFNYVDYNIVYKQIDNSIYVISDDEKFMKRITIKESNNYCIVENNESLHIYETDCNNVNNAKRYFNLNTSSRNKEVTEIDLKSDL